MNLAFPGQQSIYFHSNPSKTFWKASFRKYTNFGKQNFRLDPEGTPALSLNGESTFTFKVKRYADLLMDTYICITLPTIWSPIMPPQPFVKADGSVGYTEWAPYEFRWIDHIGAQIVRQITISCGNQTLQQFSGQYILCEAQRDFSGTKLAMFYEMIGHVPELNDPANAGSRVNAYPNAFYTTSPAGAEPSIPARTLYIPLGAWFTMMSTQAFPLAALQYNELQISVTFRPLNEWFTIRDVADYANLYPVVAPNFNQAYMQFHRFLQSPPDVALAPESYVDKRTAWRADIHLNATYCFLSNDEVRLFARAPLRYLIKQIFETPFYNITGQTKVSLVSNGMVSAWMFYLQRSDAHLRNQWSNYTNWPYNYLPQDVVPATTNGDLPVTANGSGEVRTIGPGVNVDGSLTGLFVTGDYNPQNIKHILQSLAIVVDGQYRENMLPAPVYQYVEKFVRTSGHAPPGIYCYQFCLDTNPFSAQPSGAMNMSRYKNVEVELSTIIPPFDPYAQVLTLCDPATGETIGVNKPSWRVFDYNFNLYWIEERYNFATFVGGNVGLSYAT